MLNFGLVKRVLITLFLTLNVFRSESQISEGFECRFKTGILAAHRGVLSHLPVQSALATEFSYFKRLKDDQSWAKKINYPTVGAAIFIGSVGNNEILGRYGAIYGFADVPILLKNRFEVNWRFGTGLGYTNRVYDPILNPKNMAISSHLNAMIVMGVKSVYRFNHNSLSLGVDITHFSNCAFKIPNYGINIPYVSMSYARNLKEDSVSSIRKQIMKYRKLYFGTHGIFSLKEINPHGSRKYPVFAIGAYGRYYFQQKAGAELGIDVISKQSVFDFEPQVDKTQLSIIQLGIYAGYILPLNHLHFFFGMGAYVRDRYQPNGPLYHRIGFRYQMSNGMYGNITLKTHWAKADYMEVGLGYIVNYKNKD
jgi:hypothetical protein